jgi:hypothetical protein
MLNPATRLDDILNGLPKRVNSAYLASGDVGSQIPDSDGRFAQNWCVWQCRPDAGDLLAAPRPFASASPTGSFQIAANSGARAAKAAISDRSRKSVQGMPRRSSANTLSMQDHVIFDRLAGQNNSAPQQRGLRVEVFWCDDLPGTEARRARAMLIGERLGEFARREDAPTAGSLLGQLNFVRVRRLPLAANLFSEYRYDGNFIVVDDNDEGEARIARAITDSDPTQLPIRRNGRTPDYVSVVICQADGPANQAPRVVIQVPTMRWLDLGRELRGNLLRAFPRAEVSSDVDVVPQSPADTEVRFYHFEDRDSVFEVTASLEERLGVPVRIRYLPQYASVTRAGQMEVWLGREVPEFPLTSSKAVHPNPTKAAGPAFDR